MAKSIRYFYHMAEDFRIYPMSIADSVIGSMRTEKPFVMPCLRPQFGYLSKQLFRNSQKLIGFSYDRIAFLAMR